MIIVPCVKFCVIICLIFHHKGTRLIKYLFPASQWLKSYNKQDFKSDLLASGIVIALLIPQGMAYALVAGLPPIMGLYASILPIMLYAIFGGSPTLSIGPVAILSMMTFAFLNPLFPVGSAAYLEAACLLALLTGVISVLLGILRFGFLIQLISHPVIQSFIIAASLLIALGQLRFLFNIPLRADNLPQFVITAWQHAAQADISTLIVGVVSMLFLIYLPKIITRFTPQFKTLCKVLPLLLVICAILLNQTWTINVPTVGLIPSGLPQFSMPNWTWDLVLQLLPAATLIAMINFIESLSIAEATALQKRQHLNSNQELIAIGVSNLAAGLTHGFPVGGSLSRTVVNADAGAKSPLVGVFVGLFIVIISLYFTQVFFHLPLAVLAATIIVSIWKLVKIQPFIHTWQYSKADGLAMLITFFAVLLIDVSTGLMIGVISTFALLLWKMSRPHVAIIGLVEGTQHFRNIQRYKARTCPEVFSLRIDEALTFLNAHPLKAYIIDEVSQNLQLKHVVINCSGISNIDFSALEMLEDVNHELLKLKIQLHLSEVKGPVMDQLKNSNFFNELSGQVFLSHYQAMQHLSPSLCKEPH
ncbi:MAG: sulfate permease [Acinetobacter sp.]|nr:sulfate permease [Acinetobacter sp.]